MKSSLRIYFYLTEDEMNVHQAEIEAGYDFNNLEYNLLYKGSKDNIPIKFTKFGKKLKFATSVLLYEVNE